MGFQYSHGVDDPVNTGGSLYFVMDAIFYLIFIQSLLFFRNEQLGNLQIKTIFNHFFKQGSPT